MSCTSTALRLGCRACAPNLQHAADTTSAHAWRRQAMCKSTNLSARDRVTVHAAVATDLSTPAAHVHVDQEQCVAPHIPVLLSEILAAFHSVHMKV